MRDENYHIIQCGCCVCWPKICGTDFECGKIDTDLRRRMRVNEILNVLVDFITVLENTFQAMTMVIGFCKSKAFAVLFYAYEWGCFFDYVFLFINHCSYRLTHKSWCCCDGCKCICDYPCKCCSKLLLCVNFLTGVLCMMPGFPVVMLAVYQTLVKGTDRECTVTFWSITN